MPVQYAARVVVDPVYCFLYAAGRYLAEVGTFGEKPSYHLVLLLVAAALVGGVRVAVVDMGPGSVVFPPGPLHSPAVGELAAVDHIR